MKSEKNFLKHYLLLIVVVALVGVFLVKGMSSKSEKRQNEDNTSQAISSAEAKSEETSEEVVMSSSSVPKQQESEQMMTLSARAVLSTINLLEVHYDEEGKNFLVKVEIVPKPEMLNMIAKKQVNGTLKCKVDGTINTEGGPQVHLVAKEENMEVTFYGNRTYEIALENPTAPFPVDELFLINISFHFKQDLVQPIGDSYTFVISLICQSNDPLLFKDL